MPYGKANAVYLLCVEVRISKIDDVPAQQNNFGWVERALIAKRELVWMPGGT